MNPLPFRVKIAALSTLVSGAVLVGFGITAYVMIARQKIQGLDTEIRSLGTRHPGWLAGRRSFEQMDEGLAAIIGEGRRDAVILAVRDGQGKLKHKSPGWPREIDPLDIKGDSPSSGQTPAINPPAEPRAETATSVHGGHGRGAGGGGMGPGRGMGAGRTAFTSTIHGLQTINTMAGEWRLGMIDASDITLIIGMSTDQVRSELAQLRVGLLLALPLALVLIAFGGWLVSGQALRPIRAIAGTAEQVTARGLDQRIPLAGADPEIGRVIEVLNRMMDRLQASFQQAIRFSADASHELKTPLAIMQGELEHAIQEASPGSREQQVFGNLLEETQRLKTITRGLLMLARADAGQLQPALEAVNLGSMLGSLVEDARLLAEDAGLEFDLQIAGDITIRADPALLHTALLNLLVNAVKYNEPGGRVRVVLEPSRDQILVSVGNSGPGIPEADQGLLFSRFHRVDAARQRKVDGIGLGLSLAREIARAHGGELRLQESRPGWTSFALTLNRS